MTPEEMDAEQERQIRELATQITQMTKLGFDPITVRKGIIAAVAADSAPPTVSINLSGDEDTLVTQVRTLNNYTPVVGQTVLVGKQGTDIFLLGSIASVVPSGAPTAQVESTGWTKATISSGTHGGSGSDIYYRRVLDHGSWKMQWRGVWNVSGSSTMINSGVALDTEYRPSNYRAISCGRNAVDAPTIRMDFNADGTVQYYLDAPTLNINSSAPGGSTSTNGSHSHYFADTYNASGNYLDDSTGSAGSHSHDVFVNSHFHGGTTSVAAPTWVSLNGVEYFL